ncbi:MAG: DUF3299 domain-containing protein [Planctomycetota bacterium]
MDRLLPTLLVTASLAHACGCGGTAAKPVTAPAVVERPATPAPPAAEARPAPRATAATFREITFDDIKLDMEKGAPFTRDLLPARVTSLAGTGIRIRGYILPSFQQTGLTQFVLVRDNQECCFGPGAALHDCIVVRMRPGKSADFSIRPVAVAGTFKIDELRAPDGSHLAIYALEGDEVK